jgi:hypothetical protein
MAEFKCDIENIIATLEEKGSWSTIFAKISWNNKPAKWDIRSYDGKNVYKGISLSDEALEKLVEAIIDSGVISKKKLNKMINKIGDADDAEEVEEIVNSYFDMDDFEMMFKEVGEENTFIKDIRGRYRDDDGYIRILAK